MIQVLLAAWLLGCNPLPDASGFPDREEEVDDDDDDDGLVASIVDVCERLDRCGLWSGLESCVQERLSPENCALRTGYLACMPFCLELDTCERFDLCEADCWTDECELDEDVNELGSARSTGR